MTTISSNEIDAAKPLSRWWTIAIPLAVTTILLPVIATATGVLLLWMIHSWNVPFWAICVLGVIFILSGTYLLWRFLRRLARQRFQFSIRGLLLFMAIFALFFSLFWNRLNQIWHQQRTIARIENTGGYGPSLYVDDDWENCNWLRKKYNFDPFVEISDLTVWSDDSISVLLKHRDQFPDLEYVFIDTGVTDRGLKEIPELRHFPKFKSLLCVGVSFTDAGLEHITQCQVLKSLSLFSATPITDQGLEHLQALRELERLEITGESGKSSRITNVGLKYISRMTHLRRLRLGCLPLTDAGLDEIGKMTNLRVLELHDLSITDEGLKRLSNLTNLTTLDICNCTVTKQGLIEWGRRLPDCRIFLGFEDLAEQIGQIDVWQVATDEQRLKQITDSTQIVKIMEYYYDHHWDAAKPGQWKHHQKDEHLEGIRIDARGRTRSFFQFLLRDGECFIGHENSWTSHPIPLSEEKEFLELLGLDYAQYFGQAK